jgi:hypothetical protein
MTYHILNGDSLAYSFPETQLPGEVIVVREALIDGPLTGRDLPDFWQTRARYIGVSETEYQDRVAQEFEKLMRAPEHAAFNLWFEFDLFCQVNMWFVLSLLRRLPVHKKVYAVYSSYLKREDKHFWNGFGPATADELLFSFKDRILLDETDLQLGDGLWHAYKSENLEALNQLSRQQGTAFPYLQEVIQAHLDRFPRNGGKGRPERVIEEIAKNTAADFPTVFREFWKKESIYGFGDTQLKHLYDKVMQQE